MGTTVAQHVYEPGRDEEYADMLRVRCGLYPCYPGYKPELADIYTKLLMIFGHEWAASHNQKALQNQLDKIIEECSDIGKTAIPEYAKIHVMNIAWDIFKCAWINYDEYLPKQETKGEQK